MNAVSIIGRLARDPETKYGASGTAVARMTVAVDRISKDGGADFIPVKVFGKTAENCERFLRKGRQVGITGRIQTGSYEKKDGSKVYTVEVIADRVEFIGKAEAEETPAQVDLPDDFKQIEADIPF